MGGALVARDDAKRERDGMVSVTIDTLGYQPAPRVTLADARGRDAVASLFSAVQDRADDRVVVA